MMYILNNELVQTFLETKHEVKKDVFKEEIHKSVLMTNELKCGKDKLQYKEFVK